MSETEMIDKTAEIAESNETPPTAESARLFTVSDVEERLRAARAEWESGRDAAIEAARAAAFADGEIAAAAAHSAEIRVLEEELCAAKTAAARRETEIRCARYLRERSLGEEMTEILLAPGETEVADEVLLARVSALSNAVEAAAIRALREKTEGILPGASGGAAPLTGRIIRETPVARLAEMMG